MSTNRFLTLIAGVPRLVSAIAASVGIGDAGKIVATGGDGQLDNSLVNWASPPQIGDIAPNTIFATSVKAETVEIGGITGITLASEPFYGVLSVNDSKPFHIDINGNTSFSFYPSGGFTLGVTIFSDPGANNFTVEGIVSAASVRALDPDGSNATIEPRYIDFVDGLGGLFLGRTLESEGMLESTDSFFFRINGNACFRVFPSGGIRIGNGQTHGVGTDPGANNLSVLGSVFASGLVARSGSFNASITAPTLAGDRSYLLPSQSGTLARIEDIPSGSGAGTTPPTTVTASKTLALADAQSLQYCTNSTPITITVPADATTDFPAGSVVFFTQDGTGVVTIAQESPTVSVRKAGTEAVTGHTTNGRYTQYRLQKVAPNEWRLNRTTPMSFIKTYPVLFGTANANPALDPTLVTISTSGTSIGPEIDLLGEDFGMPEITLFAIVTTNGANATGSIDIRVDGRIGGATYSKSGFEYSVPTVATATSVRTQIGTTRTTRRIALAVRNNNTQGTTSVAIVGELTRAI